MKNASVLCLLCKYTVKHLLVLHHKHPLWCTIRGVLDQFLFFILIEETEAKIRVNRKYLTISKYSASDRYRNIAAIIQMGAQEFKQSLNTVFKCDELCFFFC